MKQRFLLLGLCACVLACDSASPVAPTGTVLSVNANPTQIGLNGGSSTITVTGFKPDGNPLNPGTQILVSTDRGNLFDAATGGNQVSTLEIGGNGQTRAYLRGDGRAGNAMVTATLTTGGEASATATVQIGQTAEEQPTLTLSASPSVINLDQTSIISALARNSDGTSMGAGQQVRLRTSLGTLDAETLTTDANGEAETILRPGSITGTATVTGTVGSSAEMMVDVTFGEQAENRPTVVISANPTTITVGGTSRISLLGRNSDNTPVSAGQRIRLTANFGKVVADGGDENSPTIDSVRTDGNGEAFATFVAGDRGTNNGEVRAILGTSEEASVTIVINDVIDSLELIPETTNVDRIECDAMGGGDIIGFTAIVQDAQGTLLVGTAVTFTTDRGTFANSVVPSNNQGQALATLTVCKDQLQGDPADFVFDVTARATSEGVTKEDTVTMTVVGDP